MSKVGALEHAVAPCTNNERSLDAVGKGADVQVYCLRADLLFSLGIVDADPHE
jgi:hypothetical protein